MTREYTFSFEYKLSNGIELYAVTATYVSLPEGRSRKT